MTVRIQRETGQGESARVRQLAYVVPREHKASALGRILDVESPTATVVFCRTREQVDSLGEALVARGYRTEALHGGMTQDQRDRVMGRVRSGTAEVLVATDVAARGLDIDHLTHVVNYDVPAGAGRLRPPHRTRRTGRTRRSRRSLSSSRASTGCSRASRRRPSSKISVETLPTVADLRARRMEMTRGALEAALAEEDHERFRVVVESLSVDHDLVEIALAAIKLAHEANGGDDDAVEIPSGERETKSPRNRAADGTTVKVFVSLGHAARIRPQDLVGAIAGETSLSGRDIGAIEITHKYSTVEIPGSAQDEVVHALSNTLIKGRRARVERYEPRVRKGKP